VVCQELDSASGELDKQVALLGRRVLAGKAEFLERTKDSNISRWPVCRWWTDFLEGCVPIRLSGERKVPTLDKKIEWLLTQVAPSLVLVIGMVGADFLDLIIQYGCEKLNRKNIKEMMQHMQAQGRTPVFDLERDMADIYWDITLSILDCYSDLDTADN
ncbi:MAG: replication initiation factor domain-containing protein, partial [Oscillospiraceae bacterium]|nr:replication initiation factor domain-containing protein [Oscillospiraceae bacterium]